MKLPDQAPRDAHALKCGLAVEVLRSSGTLHLRVLGWSMLPTVWPGDTLLVERLASNEVFDGDIVLFSNGRRFVAHRVVAGKRRLGQTLTFRRKGMPCLTSIPPFLAETSSARFPSSCATASGSLRERVSASLSVPSQLSFGVLPWPPVSSWEFTASVKLLRVHHKFKLPRIESPFARANHRSRSSQPRHRNRGHPGARAYDGSSIPRNVARPLCRFCVVIAAARD